MSCFAFNRRRKECTCLKDKRCEGFNICAFYKDAEQAMQEAKDSKLMFGDRYGKQIQDVIRMIWDNQKEDWGNTY